MNRKTLDIPEFWCFVPEGGFLFEKVPAPAHAERLLIPNPGSTGTRRYQPLRDCPFLFRRFAEMKPDETGVKEFADQFGFLGHGQVLDDITQFTSQKRIIGERLAHWQSQVYTMRILVKLWDSLRENDWVFLGKVIRWTTSEIIQFNPRVEDFSDLPEIAIGAEPIAAPHSHLESLQRFQPGDTIEPAKVYLMESVKKQLEGRVALDFSLNSQGSPILRYSAKNLLGALWLQLAESIIGNAVPKHCEYCKQWFEVSGKKGSRSDKRFCSAACRNQFHLLRQEKARRLHAQGKRIKTIAKELGASVESVTRWISTK